MINWFKSLFKKKEEQKKEAAPKTIKQVIDEARDQVEESVIAPETNVLPVMPEPTEPTEHEKFLEMVDNVEIIDLRHEQPDPPPLVNGKRKYRLHNGKIFKRNLENVNGIVVHQTATKYSVSKAQLAASNGDKKLALARRALNVACHVMAFETEIDGELVQFVAVVNDLPSYMYHGNSFNSTTYGIEIAGDFPGLKDDKSTAYNDKENPSRLTLGLRVAACAGIDWLVNEAELRTGAADIEWIYAHRQSSATRRSDPGEEIWKDVVLKYAIPELGLKKDVALISQQGYSIPVEWDADASGKYWDKPLTK